MIRLAKYLKPFLSGLVLTVALLFGQAVCDLNLPNYMSEIVNIGIQQNGIEHAAPEAISPAGMKLMTTAMTDREKQRVESLYVLTAAAEKNAAGKAYSLLYPRAGERLYVQKKGEAAARDELDAAFGHASLTLIRLMRNLAAAEDDGLGLGTSTSTSAGTADTGTSTHPSTDTGAAAGTIDLVSVYGMQSMLEQLPAAVWAAAREQAAGDQSLAKQSGVVLAKSFYAELGADIGAMQTAYIIKIGLLMLLIALAGGAATVLVGLLSSRIAAGVARNLRHSVFEKVERFSGNEFDMFSTASLITRCTNDITQIQTLLIMGIRMICYAPILAIGGVVMALRKSVSMSWTIALAVIILSGLVLVVVLVAIPKFKAIQKLVDKLNLVSRENLSGLRVIRAFAAQNHEKKRFNLVNEELTAANLFVNRLMVLMMPAMMFIMNGVTLLIIWTGSRQVSNAAMQVGDMMAFMQYAMQIIMSFLMISMMFIMVPRAAVSAVRIAEVLETDISIEDPRHPKEFDPARRGLIEFKQVSFRHRGAERDALADITFTARKGEITAIIGSTGSGKSTIVNLALRFYDVSRGQILIDGLDVREARQEDLRARIGYVPQKGVLLSGTIAFNLKYGKKDLPERDMQTAATVAQAMEFIGEKPERFDAEIAQGGANVSGGQRQRLSIARALAKKPEILIFDDSFSALDFKTEAALRKALKENAGDMTQIIVAQRVSTIMNAEQIIVLDEGRMVGRGTHKELLRTCPEYFEIASSQLSKEELA
ncbi:MAG: ABC transporter ATP-binding protein/permease [Peptococcaceae bacterium]|jgi:ATP-binding cassette subfamily B protein|nr:ABC transporter ATP-binding protein/permease [Peptococcaceae bacterium]